MADTQKQSPAIQTFCGSLRREGHWKCLSLTLMIVGCLTAISWCQLPGPGKTSSAARQLSYVRSESFGPCKDGYIYIPVACVVMLYLVYLVECWHSHTRLELRHKCDIASVYSYISRMQAALPVIWWKATCYHYVRRTRQVMRYRNGDAFTSTQVYYERVDSSTAGAAFNFTQCGVRDISRPLADLDMYAAIRIRISKGFSFANVDTECQFEEQRAQFFQEYDTKDDYMEGREGMDLMDVDFKEYMIAFRDPSHLPWYVSHVAFWLASVCLLSWPLRTVTELKTAYLHYHVHKLFGSNYLNGEDYNGLMSRASTMNSAEFEISVRNNNVIVPSYSEAVLADGQELVQHKHYGAIKACPAKFPRSLTNVTLAARPSSAGRRSATPTVMMNRVKKFKSCSAFGITECPDTGTHRASVRQQIQQLLRDRTRLQRKRRTTSQFSVSSLSLANGNVRFHIGTPGTPEDCVISPSFSSCVISPSFSSCVISPSFSSCVISPSFSSCVISPSFSSCVISPSFSSHSVASSRIHDCRHAAVEDGNEASTDNCPGYEYLGEHFSNRSRPTQLRANNSIPANVINSVKSSLAPDIHDLYNLEQFPSRSNVLREMPVNMSRYSHQVTPHTLPCHPPMPGQASSVCAAATTTTTPSTPSSPPHYEEAMTMRRLTSPSITVDTEIQLTGHLQSSSASDDLGMRSSKDQHQPDPFLAVSFTVAIDSGDSFHLFCTSGNKDTIASTTSGTTSGAECLTRGPPRYSHHHQHHRNQQHHQHSQQLLLKTLPKVSNAICIESEDSDLGCLHTTVSEPEDSENILLRNGYLQSSNLHPALPGAGSMPGWVGTRAGSMSGWVGTRSGLGAGNGHFSDQSMSVGGRRNNSSSGVVTGRVSRAARVSPPGVQGRRRETSV